MIISDLIKTRWLVNNREDSNEKLVSDAIV